MSQAMLQQLVNHVIHILNRSDFEYAELQAAVIALLSSGCFFLPGQFLRLGPNLRFATAIALLMVGLAQFIGLAARIRPVRRGAAFLGAVLWFSLVSLFGSDELLLAVWSFGFGMASSWGYVRIGATAYVITGLRKAQG